MSVSQPQHQFVPLQIAGNTTEQQNKALRELLEDAFTETLENTLETLDRCTADTVLRIKQQLHREITDTSLEIIRRHMAANQYSEEDAPSKRIYPATYAIRPVEAQETILRRCFPELGTMNAKLARNPLPLGAEGWFAIPRWQALAPTYNEAVDRVLTTLASRRRFTNRLVDKLGRNFLRQSIRTERAESILANQQSGCDIFIVGAQMGMLHRGASARRAREAMLGNEFALGLFSLTSILITHPERLSSIDTIMIDCSGDECCLLLGTPFDRVPLFEFELGGVQLSLFYEDRACELWGTPSGFLYKKVESPLTP